MAHITNNKDFNFGFKNLQKEAGFLTLDIKYFPMRFSPESLEIKAAISRNVFLFKAIKSYFGAF